MSETRKADHIDLAKNSQIHKGLKDSLFDYEPLFGTHPHKDEVLKTNFLNKELDFPIWISSMTGGASKAGILNHNLAKVSKKFRLGMGLGSCRSLLDSEKFFEDFNLRPIIGSDLPFYANLGIAQLEELILNKKLHLVDELILKLKTDGIIIHVNPLQEWFQPEGDRYTLSPLEIIETINHNKKYPIVVKEVGQGFGPRSLKALIDMKVSAIELAGLGGTNFSKLETLRNADFDERFSENALINVGHTALQMVDNLNKIYTKEINTEVIISGGIENVLEGQYYRDRLKFNSVMGFGMRFLNYAHDYDLLSKFVESETKTLLMVHHFLKSKND